MFGLVLRRTIEEFLDNFRVAWSFAVLLIFILPFVFFDHFFISSGTVFLSVDNSIFTLIGILLGLIFLYAFSFFVSLSVYSIQRDIHHLTLDAYWGVLLKNAALKIFFFYLLCSILFYLSILIGLFYGFSVIVFAICLILSVLVMFVPQSIVFDEKSIFEAVEESVSFWVKNPSVCLGIVFVSWVLLLLITLVEFVLDYFMLPGILVSIALVLLLLVPFTEQMKSYAFILKNDLIRAPEIHHSHHKKTSPPKINAIRLHQKNPRGKI